ncbi:MAG: MFS transporter [Acidobacteria bacterium]|nr:MAG: MFS transporter [Acidobacteriota bacterium]
MFWSRVFLPFALGYFVSQLFRSVNAVVSADLIAELAIDAWTVGFLTSVYFLAFASVQLPVGVALDRYGPRRTEAALLLFAAFGALVFGAAETPNGLALGRALIGLGVSACLMASFHAFILWAPPARLPFMNGSVMAVGAAGALTATVPVEWAIGTIGWRALFSWLSVATVLCAAVLFFVVTDNKSAHPKESLGAVTRGLADVFRSRVFWSIAPFSIMHQGAYLSIQSLWAGPWLATVAGLPRDEVATHLLMLASAMGVGFISLGFLAERLGRLGVPTVAVWIGSSIAFQCAQLGLVLEWTRYARGLWSAFGLFGAAGMLSYVILTRTFPVAMAGRVNTGLNVFVFIGAFALQAGIGAIVQRYSEPGAPFSPEGFQMAFGTTLALQTLALVWLLARAPWRQGTRDH